jgi:hypothetical protein
MLWLRYVTKISAAFQVEAFQAKSGVLKQWTAIFISAFYGKQLYVFESKLRRKIRGYSIG